MSLTGKLMCLVIAALTCSSTMAQSSLESTARVALAKGQYQRVLDLYANASETNPAATTAIARYRVAIAAERLKKYSYAMTNLAQALSIDPSGSFASSFSRIKALNESIEKGCSLTNECSVNGSTQANETMIVQEDKVVSNEVAPAPDQPNSPAMDATSPSLSSPSPDITSTTSSSVDVQEDEPERNSAGYMVTGIALMLGLFGWALSRGRALNPIVNSIKSKLSRFRDHWRARSYQTILRISLKDQTAVSPLELQMLDSREIIAKLILMIPKEQQGSVLYLRLAETLEVLERECGRALFNRSGMAGELSIEDQQLLSTQTKLRSKPIDVLTCNPEEVSPAFQRQLWQ